MVCKAIHEPSINYGTINVVALDTWAGMTGCVWAWLFSCAPLGIITPLTVVGMPCWLIPCSVCQCGWLLSVGESKNKEKPV